MDCNEKEMYSTQSRSNTHSLSPSVAHSLTQLKCVQTVATNVIGLLLAFRTTNIDDFSYSN